MSHPTEYRPSASTGKSAVLREPVPGVAVGDWHVSEAAAAVLDSQLDALAKTARAMGVSVLELMNRVGKHLLPYIEEEAQAGYAPPEEGLAVLLQEEGGCVDVKRARVLFKPPHGVSRQSISEKIRAGEMIAYRTAGGQFLMPVWQFRPEGGLLAGLPEVLKHIRETLPGVGPLFAFTFFLQADPVTGGRTPLEALRAGDLTLVLQAVEGHVS